MAKTAKAVKEPTLAKTNRPGARSGSGLSIFARMRRQMVDDWQGRRPSALALVVAVAIIVVGILVFQASRSNQVTQSAPAAGEKPAAAPVAARAVGYEVVNSYPHDPAAFLQGLLWYDGKFYESTGLYGESTLREVDPESGKVLKSIKLSSNLFGEGLALVGDRLVQLEWKTGRGFVYDRASFKLQREFKYDTEGWGITYDGKRLIMSDGSSQLIFLDPETLNVTGKLTVRMNGNPIDNLNELEYIEGEVWANVWQTNLILRINPANGQVTSFLDMKGILAPQWRTGREDVLNGIAYDQQQKRIFISGKLWPRVFEIKLKQ